MIPIPRDFREFLKLLNRKRVRYLVVGGYAVAYHGYPRYTGSLDIFVALSTANGRALVSVFREFGFDDPSLEPSFFTDPGQVIRLGRKPMRLEIINAIDGVTFDECFRRRVRARIGGLRINFIGVNELLKNKRASDRSKDRADVETLEKLKPRKRTSR
jgi:predicted nucleotidyltransferase